MTTKAHTSISTENIPMLIGVKNALRLGITKNNFYSIIHRYDYMVVVIGDRYFLKRDDLLAWLAQGGDKCRKEAA